MSDSSPTQLPRVSAGSAGLGRVDAAPTGGQTGCGNVRPHHSAADHEPESTRPAQGVSFACAYWDYLRRVTADEPDAAQFGLAENLAECIRRQCAIEFTAQALQRARAMAAAQTYSVKS